MSQPIGMLRYKAKGDRTEAVEVSRVIFVEPCPSLDGEDKTIITVDAVLSKSSVVVFSTEDAETIMDRYDSLVNARKP